MSFPGDEPKTEMSLDEEDLDEDGENEDQDTEDGEEEHEEGRIWGGFEG